VHRQCAAPMRSRTRSIDPLLSASAVTAPVIRFHFPEDAYGCVGQRYSVAINFLGFWNGPHSWCKIDVLPNIEGPSSRLSLIMSPVRPAVRIIRPSRPSADRFRRPRHSQVYWWVVNNRPRDLRKLL
jgi:hypothetical protein